MKGIISTSAILFLALIGCGSQKNALPIVEIQDPKVNSETCDAVYYYAAAVLGLGRPQFRINGHLWHSYGPFSHGSRLVAEITPSDYENKDDLIKLISGEDKENLFYWINLDGDEPAQKLFLLMDLVEDSGARCWINPVEEDVVSSIQIYASAP